MTPQVTLEGQHFWRPRAAAERGSAPERQLPSPLDHYHRPSEPGTQPPVYDVGGESSNRTSDEELEETDLAIGIELDSPLSCGSPADTFPDSLVEGTSSTDEARHESMPTHAKQLPELGLEEAEVDKRGGRLSPRSAQAGDIEREALICPPIPLIEAVSATQSRPPLIVSPSLDASETRADAGLVNLSTRVALNEFPGGRESQVTTHSLNAEVARVDSASTEESASPVPHVLDTDSPYRGSAVESGKSASYGLAGYAARTHSRSSTPTLQDRHTAIIDTAVQPLHSREPLSPHGTALDSDCSALSDSGADALSASDTSSERGLLYDHDDSPSLTDNCDTQSVTNSLLERADEDDEEPLRKRRKTRSSASSNSPDLDLATALERVHSAEVGHDTVARGLQSPPASLRSIPRDAGKPDTASYEEWQGVVKLTTINGVTSFEGHFEGELNPGLLRALKLTMSAMKGPPGEPGGGKVRRMGKRRARRERFTDEEEKLLLSLKKQGNLTWDGIFKKFDSEFPGRSKGSIQVHYSTKLKDRN